MKKMTTVLAFALISAQAVTGGEYKVSDGQELAATPYVMRSERYQLPSLEHNPDYQRVLSQINSDRPIFQDNSGVLDSTGNGNGGDVLFCDPMSSLGATVHLLDLYEANYIKNMPIDLGSDDLSLDEKVELALSRIEVKSKLWAQRMRGYYRDFMSETAFVPDANLVNVDDSDHLAIPSGCIIKQIAIQKDRPIGPFDSRYVINETLWNLLTTNHQAALILHELIYREMLSSGNSVLTRHFVGLAVSGFMARLSLDDYITMLAQQDFDPGFVRNGISYIDAASTFIGGYGVVKIHLEDEFTINGQTFMSMYAEDDFAPIDDDKISLNHVTISNGVVERIYVRLGANVPIEVSAAGQLLKAVEFVFTDEQGQILRGNLAPNSTVDVSGYPFKADTFSLRPDTFTLSRLELNREASSPLKIPNLTADEVIRIDFYDTGEVKTVVVGWDSTFVATKYGTTQTWLASRKATAIEFSKLGHVLSIGPNATVVN